MTGKEFKLWRKGKDIMQKEVANYINCSIAYVSLFENEKVQASTQFIRKYMQFIEQFENKA